MLLGFKTELSCQEYSGSIAIKLSVQRTEKRHNSRQLDCTGKQLTSARIRCTCLMTLLAKNHGRVVIEDLNVSGKMANHNLATSIADMGFFEFRCQLTYKCQLYGCKLVVVDRQFPSSKTCSNCGIKKETLSLDERVFECDYCAFKIDRDLNAAIILSKTVSQRGLACGLVSADTARMKQEVSF